MFNVIFFIVDMTLCRYFVKLRRSPVYFYLFIFFEVMDFDNLFDNIIEYDAGSVSDKENEEISNPIRQPRTTNAQFKTIALFIQGIQIGLSHIRLC